MDFFKIVDTRKTIRNYEDFIPPKSDIERIINSARLAPSAVNAQNWEFLAIYNQEIKEKMAEAVLKAYEELETHLDEATKAMVERFKGHSTFFTNAPVLIVCVLTSAPSFLDGVFETADYDRGEIALMRPDSQLLSMGGAIENMALSATALGLGTCWMVAPVIAQKEFKKILNIKNEDKIVSLLTVGKPVKSDGRSNKKNLDEIMKIID